MEEEPEETVARREIRKLDEQTAKRITSDQIITHLHVAVKELVENALDANATTLVLRFTNKAERVEVIDNGHGIEQSNFHLLGQENCTSKLSTFEDLDHVGTFGFRGEAISSLCKLSNLTIHTRHATDSIGTILKFDHDGKIIHREAAPREVGTTVTLTNLFQRAIPVRHREMTENYKSSFDKTLLLLYQYCIGRIGLKMSCFIRKPREATMSNLFKCNGLTIQSNIIEFTKLMPFVMHTDLENPPADPIELQISGFISKPDTGCGRSSSDRQFFYLNERPCELESIRKLINSMYKSYNRHQFPFVILKLSIEERFIDRNLTPDKRKIFLADKHYIYRVVQHSLNRIFARETNDVASLSSSRLLTSFLSSTPLKRNLDDTAEPDNHPSTSKIFKRCPSPCDSSFELDLPDKSANVQIAEQPSSDNITVDHPSNLTTSLQSVEPSFASDNNNSMRTSTSKISSPPSSRLLSDKTNEPQINKPAFQPSIKHPFFTSFSNFKLPSKATTTTTITSDETEQETVSEIIANTTTTATAAAANNSESEPVTTTG